MNKMSQERLLYVMRKDLSSFSNLVGDVKVLSGDLSIAMSLIESMDKKNTDREKILEYIKLQFKEAIERCLIIEAMVDSMRLRMFYKDEESQHFCE